MVCIYCGSRTRVKNSRPQLRGNTIWRRRACDACSSLFTTVERPELQTALMIKLQNGKLSPFRRDRLFLDIYASCKHRPAALDDATALTQTVLNKLLASQTTPAVERAAITKTVQEVLKHFDPAAATIYAAYHPLP